MPQTGATRYQKFLKSEKGKTKLKAKKDLPKGTNVTKTNFKVKKIVIKEQLKKHAINDLVSTRKLNVNDLLSRLNHFNVHSRVDALNGLKELFTIHSEVIHKNLGQLIHGVTPLVLNVEKSVRLESLNVISTVLSKALAEKLEPFYDFLSTYLRSAMTHIDSRIQEDSLLFLDVLLETTAENIAKDFHRVIPNFLDMISKLRVDSKPGRTLTVNLKSQMTSVKWRVKVLYRLQKFLKKIVDIRKKNDNTKGTDKAPLVFNTKRSNNFPLFKETHISNCILSIFMTKGVDSTPLDEVEKFKTYIEILMPLLFETWLEVCPTANIDNATETVLTEEAAILLKLILNVISLIWDLIEILQKSNPSSDIMRSVRNKYRKPFSQHFVKGFPFVTNKRFTSKSNASSQKLFEDTISDPKMIEQNISICHMFILLNPDVRTKQQLKGTSPVISYIEKTLNQNSGDSMLKVLHLLFCSNIEWRKNTSLLKPLFHKIISVFLGKQESEPYNNVLFTLLCTMAINLNLKEYHDSDEFTMWTSELPKILIQDQITKDSVDMMHKIATLNNEVFNLALTPELVKISENLPYMKVVDGEDIHYKKLYSLLYWINAWDELSLDLMEKHILKNRFKPIHCKYIVETLMLKTCRGIFEFN